MDYMPLFVPAPDSFKDLLMFAPDYAQVAEVRAATVTFVMYLDTMNASALITYHGNDAFTGTHYIMTPETGGTDSNPYFTPPFGVDAFNQFAKIVAQHFDD